MKCKVDGVQNRKLKKYLNQVSRDDELLLFEATATLLLASEQSESCQLCGTLLTDYRFTDDLSIATGICSRCRMNMKSDDDFFYVPMLFFATNMRVGFLLTHRNGGKTIAPLSNIRLAYESDGKQFVQLVSEDAPNDPEQDLVLRFKLDEQFENAELLDQLDRIRFNLPMRYASERLPEIMGLIRSNRGGQEEALQKLLELKELDPLFAGYDILIAKTLESLGHNNAAVNKLVTLWERALQVEPGLFMHEFMRFEWHSASLRLIPDMSIYTDSITREHSLLVAAFEALAGGRLNQCALKCIEFCEVLMEENPSLKASILMSVFRVFESLHRPEYHDRLSQLLKSVVDMLKPSSEDEDIHTLVQLFEKYIDDPPSFDLNVYLQFRTHYGDLPLSGKLMLALVEEDFSTAATYPYAIPDPDLPDNWAVSDFFDSVHWELGSGEHRLVHRVGRLVAQWRNGDLQQTACWTHLNDLEGEYDIELLASDNESYYWIYYFLKAEMLILDNRADDVLWMFEEAQRKLGKRFASQLDPYHYYADTLVRFYEAWAYGSLLGMRKALQQVPDGKPFLWLQQLYSNVADSSSQKVRRTNLDDQYNELNKLIDQMQKLLADSLTDEARQELSQQIHTIRQRLAEKELRLALGGETSSGKTTFLNNIFETNLFFVTPEEATGTPTEIRRGDRLRIEAYNEKDELIESMELDPTDGDKSGVSDIEQARAFIEKHTNVNSSRRAALVRVYLPVAGLHDDLVIIDTPGFNAHEERSGIAKAVIQRSHACIFLIDARNALKAGEMKIIEATQSEVAKSFFVLNKMDLVAGDDDLDVDDDAAEDLKQRVSHTLSQHFGVEDVVVYAVSSIPPTDLPAHLQTIAAPYREQLFVLRDNLFRETLAQRVSYLADAATKEAIRVVEANREMIDRVTESHHETARKLQDALPSDLELFSDEIYMRLSRTFEVEKEGYYKHISEILNIEFPNALDAFIGFLNGVQSKSDLKGQAQQKAKQITNTIRLSIEDSVQSEQKRLLEKVVNEMSRIIVEIYQDLPFEIQVNRNQLKSKLLKVEGGKLISDDSEGLESGNMGMIGGAATGAVVGSLILGPLGTALGAWLGGAVFGKSIDKMKEELYEHYQSGLRDYYDKLVDELYRQMDFSENSSFTQTLNSMIISELERLQHLVQQEIESKTCEWDRVFKELLEKKRQQMELLVAAERLTAMRKHRQQDSLAV